METDIFDEAIVVYFIGEGQQKWKPIVYLFRKLLDTKQ